MRSRPALRLVAALLALVTGFSNPVTAIAHGVAHEHEAHRVAHLASPATIQAVDAAVAPDSPAGEEHPFLHAQCTAVVDLAAALPRATWVSVPDAEPPRVVAPSNRWDLDGSPPERSSPPDQPRAPPLG